MAHWRALLDLSLNPLDTLTLALALWERELDFEALLPREKG